MGLWLIWFIEILPNFGEYLGYFGQIVVYVSCVVFAASIIQYQHIDGEDRQPLSRVVMTLLKPVNKFIVVGVLAIFMSAMIPSQNGMYRIVGAYMVTNIDGVANLPPAVVETLNTFMQNIQAEMSAEKLAEAAKDVATEVVTKK